MTPEQATELDVSGHPVVTGKRVRLKDGREGEIDRVAMGDGALYVWFGQTVIPDHNPQFPAAPMRIGVEEIPCGDAELIA